MGKSAVVRARIAPELKGAAEAVLAELGLSTTEAITMMYTQLALRRRLPDALAGPDERPAVRPARGDALLKVLPTGMWAERTDMSDSSAYARRLRHEAETRTRAS